jgi:hypothetical protein
MVYFWKEDSSRVEGHPLLIEQKREEAGEPLPVAPHEILAQLIQCARQLRSRPRCGRNLRGVISGNMIISY